MEGKFEAKKKKIIHNSEDFEKRIKEVDKLSLTDSPK